MNFKLKFHTSVATSLETYEIKANIQLELKDKKYIVDHVTDRSVVFNTDGWRFAWNTEPVTLDSGEFVIADDPINQRTITLNYYYNLLWPLLMITGLSIAMISNGMYWAIPFFAAFLCVALTIDIWRTKSSAKELIASINQVDTR